MKAFKCFYQSAQKGFSSLILFVLAEALKKEKAETMTIAKLSGIANESVVWC